MAKKNTAPEYIPITPFSYFMDKIFPHVVTLAIAFCVWVVVNLFDVMAFSSQVRAEQDDYVRKETQEQRDKGQDAEIVHVNQTLIRLEKGQEALLRDRGLPVPKE